MAATQRFERIISADSHVVEPLDIWWKAIRHRLGDRTPRMIHEYKGHDGDFFFTGTHRGGVLRNSFSPETTKAVTEAQERGLGDVGIDPEIRVRFQKEAGIQAEVLSTTPMLEIMRGPDIEVLQACAEVFNDREAEFCSYNPKQLIGVSVIPLHNVDRAIKDQEKIVGGKIAKVFNVN